MSILSEAREDFLGFLNLAAGTHAFALAGLRKISQETASRPRANSANPDPVVGWATGDPNLPGNILSRPGWRRSELIKNLAPRAISDQFLGWANLVYDRWEGDYHHRIAAILGCAHGEVRCDVMGDLRRIRNDITHNRGVATKDESGRC